MKILYFFFDFTRNGTKPEGYRGHKTRELNFGTKDRYHLEPPGENETSFSLIRESLSSEEQISPGFWGNERLYNISALVGDNGSGKSMLIHEMICCLMSSFHEHMSFEKLEEPPYPFLFIVESADDEVYIVTHHIDLKPSSLIEQCKQVFIPIEPNDSGKVKLNWGLDPQKPRKEYGVLRKTKMIYFSNAITMADKVQKDCWNYYAVYDSKGYSTNSQYISPMYDCSLVADMSEAIKTSRSREGTFDEHLNTYFNFRSYQEARYLFDRNQRKILFDLRDEHKLPIPLPKQLKIAIMSPFSGVVKNDDWQKLHIYYNDDRFCDAALRIAASLSMNCILSFCDEERLLSIWDHPDKSISHLDNKSFFLSLLDFCNELFQEHPSDFYEICRSYINFLWNNISLITLFWFPSSNELSVAGNITAEITLGNEIDSRLEEFMIQFINLTRAVSKHRYFVIYNWGLSSGESNLLHMFTKLRYALSGNIYDKDATADTIIEKPEAVKQHVKREEKLLSTTDNKTFQDCDSVIIFIDEADLTYHPEWQRQFISILTEFLPALYSDPYYAGSGAGCKEIQIILSTHSPLMLGDFPASSVTYLRKDEIPADLNSEYGHLITFGENIYTILRDGFYLKNGAIGEFARRKIEKVFSDTAQIRQEAKKENAFLDWKKEKIQWELDCLSRHEKNTVQYLARGIIRSKLEEEINACRRILCDRIGSAPPEQTEEQKHQVRIQQLKREETVLEERINALKRKLEASE